MTLQMTQMTPQIRRPQIGRAVGQKPPFPPRIFREVFARSSSPDPPPDQEFPPPSTSRISPPPHLGGPRHHKCTLHSITRSKTIVPDDDPGGGCFYRGRNQISRTKIMPDLLPDCGRRPEDRARDRAGDRARKTLEIMIMGLKGKRNRVGV